MDSSTWRVEDSLCYISSHLKNPSWAAEMAQKLRVLTVLPEDLDTFPNTHMTAPTFCNSGPR